MARAYPISDQSIVQRIASSFLDGDYSELTGEGYLVAYPQQLGIIGIIQIIYYIFGKDNYIAIMLFNVLAMAGIFNMLYKILTKMTDNIRIHNLYWVMVFGCFPLIFYSFFVYGTIFGLVFSLVGFLHGNNKQKQLFDFCNCSSFGYFILWNKRTKIKICSFLNNLNGSVDGT